MLPFLKDKREGGSAGPVESIKRDSDSGEDSYGMIDAIAEDMLDAVHKRDKKLLRSTLEALIEHIKDEDETQDKKDMK